MRTRSVDASAADDVPMQLREDGPADGPVIVLVHGFSGSMWWVEPIVPLLSHTCRVIRVDLLGHASTGGHAADAPQQATQLDAVLARLDVSDVTVVGHSFGADVAVELAERSPRVARLVIVAQAPDYSDAVLPRGNVLMTVPVVRSVLHRLAQPVGVALAAYAGLRGGGRGSSQASRRALADLKALDVGMFRVVLVDRRARLDRRPLDAQVRDTGKPTLVILGGRDHFYGARSADRYRAAGARVAILDDSGHHPFLDAPTETADLLRNFATGSGP